MPLYIWSYREGSTTTNKAFKLRNNIGHFYRNKYVTEHYISRGIKDAYAMAARTITDVYAALTQKEPLEGSEELEKLVIGFLNKYRAGLRTVSREKWEVVMQASVREAIRLKILNPDRPLFGDWLKDLERKWSA